MSFYDDDNVQQGERQLIGYDGYDKSEIFEGDDYVKYKGQFYHRVNFVQMCLNERGEIINPDEEE